MAKQLKLIPFSSLQMEDISSLPDPANPSGSDRTLPALSPSFSLRPQGTQQGETASVDFAFPADDYRRVESWFTGDASHVTQPASATLKKNMTTAVKAALDSYLSSAASRNLFLSPFVVGCRYRLFDGSVAEASEPLLLSPAEEPLRMVISGYNLYEKALHTAVVFSQSPSQLLFSLPCPADAAEFLDIITDVEFYICAPAALCPADFSVSGIRSVTVGGVRERVWYYSANDIETMKASVAADRDFRVIATVPFADIAAGLHAQPAPLPVAPGALEKFSSLPKLSARRPAASAGTTASAGAVATIPNGAFTGIDGWRPYLHVQTPPLDLGLPEKAKSVCDIYLRGVFDRDKVVMTLYGSHHRENWRYLARSRGPFLRTCRRAPYRWLRVELSLPFRRDDFLDCLTFKFLAN